MREVVQFMNQCLCFVYLDFMIRVGMQFVRKENIDYDDSIDCKAMVLKVVGQDNYEPA